MWITNIGDIMHPCIRPAHGGFGLVHFAPFTGGIHRVEFRLHTAMITRLIPQLLNVTQINEISTTSIVFSSLLLYGLLQSILLFQLHLLDFYLV